MNRIPRRSESVKKFIYAIAVLAFVPLIFAVVLSSPVFAASEPFIVKDRDWFRQSGGKLSDAPTPYGSQGTEAGWLYWLYAVPDTSDEAKGAERGMYFYDEKSKKYSFMSFGGVGVSVNGVHFSPDGKTFVVESTSENIPNDIALELFDFADKTSLFKTSKAAGTPWWMGTGRFVFSRFEPGTNRGRPADYHNEWMSLAMYDMVSGKETVLKEATEKSDFILMGVSEDGAAVVWEEYVDFPKNWADPDKAKYREIIVPLPPAG
jgi:hypothetical protein